jgi:GNAT superfamily N-acetyltransferase
MVQEINFNEILPIWKNNLWPDRKSPIEPVTSMKYLGGYDLALKEFKPIFLAIKDNDKIVGVNSGVKTSQSLFRSRGLWVDPEYRGKNFGVMLLEETIKIAKEQKLLYVWSVPRVTALNTYLKAGFKKTSDFFDEKMEFGPNCYVLKNLD